ncbi:MAG: hypothetical protein K6T73_11465 [Candidatus Bathyarchaeota archaeon]|nr:hypothetical protein [Candidatus Bathyarchaeota archaeon]
MMKECEYALLQELMAVLDFIYRYNRDAPKLELKEVEGHLSSRLAEAERIYKREWAI